MVVWYAWYTLNWQKKKKKKKKRKEKKKNGKDVIFGASWADDLPCKAEMLVSQVTPSETKDNLPKKDATF